MRRDWRRSGFRSPRTVLCGLQPEEGARARVSGEAARKALCLPLPLEEYYPLSWRCGQPIPAEEAALRRGARSSAARQLTIEANGIDCGASSLVDGRPSWAGLVRLRSAR